MNEVREITVRSLIWDKWNREHIAKHNLTPRQTEQVFHDQGRIIESGHSKRLKIIGKCGKRMLTVILSAEGKKFYVVTVRDADKKERKLYRLHQEEREAEK